MGVLIINGSPQEFGTTRRALDEIVKSLSEEGIESEIITVGNKFIHGCTACGACAGKEACVFSDDIVNELIIKAKKADGIIIGSPVYYASINGTLKSLLDRMFYAKTSFAGKPGCAVVAARRAGTTATIDIINKYFMISNMPIISSQYWNMVHGSNGLQAEQDIEGLQTMYVLGKNLAWLIKCIKIGKENGVDLPDYPSHVKTNFVR